MRVRSFDSFFEVYAFHAVPFDTRHMFQIDIRNLGMSGRSIRLTLRTSDRATRIRIRSLDSF